MAASRIETGATPRATPIAALLIAIIQVYRRFLSPLMPPACRFTPSCSAYAVEALREYGAARGGWLAARRLLRCHPGSSGGYDPVPSRGGRVREGLDGSPDDHCVPVNGRALDPVPSHFS